MRPGSLLTPFSARDPAAAGSKRQSREMVPLVENLNLFLWKSEVIQGRKISLHPVFAAFTDSAKRVSRLNPLSSRAA